MDITYILTSLMRASILDLLARTGGTDGRTHCVKGQLYGGLAVAFNVIEHNEISLEKGEELHDKST